MTSTMACPCGVTCGEGRHVDNDDVNNNGAFDRPLVHELRGPHRDDPDKDDISE
jgi:hypothetical protein